MVSLRSRIFALLALLPLLIGAVVVLAGFSIDRSWSASSAGDQSAGAPIASAPGGADAGQLSAARRAAGEAGANAGLLKTGTGQLVDGTGKLKDGAGQLGGGMKEAQSGSAQLANAMRQLQSGTGELGAGATELADGVGTAVDQIMAIAVVRGQLLEALDQLDKELGDSIDPRAKKMRSDLAGYRGQVESMGLGDDVTGQLNRLKDGSRELANQLSTPGFKYHDGIYAATDGAQKLQQGLGQLGGGVDEAVKGVGQLDEGAQRIDAMAQQNRDKIGAVQRALPAMEPAAAAGPADDSEHRRAVMPPLYALMMVALAGLGGMAGGIVWLNRRRDGWTIGVGAAAAASVLFWLLSGAGVLAGLAATGAMMLSAAAAAVLTLIVLKNWQSKFAAPVVAGLGLVQVGFVGWVWRMAIGSEPATVWQAISALSPLHWGTAAVTAAGNGTGQFVGLIGSALIAAVVLFGVLSILGSRSATGDDEYADDEYAEEDYDALGQADDVDDVAGAEDADDWQEADTGDLGFAPIDADVEQGAHAAESGSVAVEDDDAYYRRRYIDPYGDDPYAEDRPGRRG